MQNIKNDLLVNGKGEYYASVFTKIDGTINLTWTGKLQNAEILVRTEKDKSSDLFLDDFYCSKIEIENESK